MAAELERPQTTDAGWSDQHGRTRIELCSAVFAAPVLPPTLVHALTLESVYGAGSPPSVAGAREFVESLLLDDSAPQSPTATGPNPHRIRVSGGMVLGRAANAQGQRGVGTLQLHGALPLVGLLVRLRKLRADGAHRPEPRRRWQGE